MKEYQIGDIITFNNVAINKVTEGKILKVTPSSSLSTYFYEIQATDGCIYHAYYWSILELIRTAAEDNSYPPAYFEIVSKLRAELLFNEALNEAMKTYWTYTGSGKVKE